MVCVLGDVGIGNAFFDFISSKSVHRKNVSSFVLDGTYSIRLFVYFLFAFYLFLVLPNLQYFPFLIFSQFWEIDKALSIRKGLLLLIHEFGVIVDVAYIFHVFTFIVNTNGPGIFNASRGL